MKRYIHADVNSEVSTGFLFNLGSKDFFWKSDATNVTDKIARVFINAVCDLKGVGDKIRQSALYNEATLKDFKRRIIRATLEHRDTGEITYWVINEPNGSSSFPEDDFDKDVIILN